jgi:hypothetical protein
MDREEMVDDITQGVPTYGELRVALERLIEEDCGGEGLGQNGHYLLATSPGEIECLRLLVRLGSAEIKTEEPGKIRALWIQRDQV